MRGDRSVVDVLNDIFGNLQDIVRSEIRLAKAEAVEDLRGARSAALGFGIALLAAAFAGLFLLLSGMYALSLVMSTWGAALCVAVATGVFSAVAYLLAVRRIRTRAHVTPRTAASIKENVEWAKPSLK